MRWEYEFLVISAEGRGAQSTRGMDKDAKVAGPPLTGLSLTSPKSIIVNRGARERRMMGDSTEALSCLSFSIWKVG